MRSMLWTQEVCNPLPAWGASGATFVPIGAGMMYDPLNPTAPVMKAAEPMCKLYPDMQPSGVSEPGLWGPGEASE